jgi:hypothetical protein
MQATWQTIQVEGASEMRVYNTRPEGIAPAILTSDFQAVHALSARQAWTFTVAFLHDCFST